MPFPELSDLGVSAEYDLMIPGSEREVSGLNVGLPFKIESTDPVSITSEAPRAKSPPARALAHRPCCHTPRAKGALAQMVIGCFLPHTRPMVCKKAGRHTGTPASLWVRRNFDMWVALQPQTCLSAIRLPCLTCMKHTTSAARPPLPHDASSITA